jgi:flagellar motor switch protein FliG
VRLNDRDIQKVLREVDAADLVKALVISNEEVKKKILKNMSIRAGAMLTEDIKYLGGVPRRDSFMARKTVVNAIYRLAKCGEIVIPHFEGEILDDLY